MLQVITGRFFKSQGCYETPRKGILYSNYSWGGPINTPVGTLEPVDHFGAVSAYVFSYVNRMEKPDEPRAGVLVAVGEEEIVRQFHLLAMLGLQAYFSTDRAAVLSNCRPRAISSDEPYVPSRFVQRILDSQLRGTIDEINRFKSVLDKVLHLPRKKYTAVIDVLDAIDRALQAANGSLDLAYSMIVYCLESLAQKFDRYQPTWLDYEPRVRDRLDKILEISPFELADQIRETLLEASHLKLSARFRDFVTTHVSEDFFIDRARGQDRPLRPSQLHPALKNAYKHRSGYVHRLQSVREQLHHPEFGEGEVFEWDDGPHLTLRGLLNLTFYVLNSFIARAEWLDRETVDWQADLPGTIQLKAGPELWDWAGRELAELPTEQRAPLVRMYFEGLLQLIVSFATARGKLIDIRQLLGVYEKLLPRCTGREQNAMLATYFIFNVLLGENSMPGFREVSRKYEKQLQERAIEFIVIELILCDRILYEDYDGCMKAYDAYCTQRYASGTIQIPVLLEIKLLCALANMALEKGHETDRSRFLGVAIGEASGNAVVQELIKTAQSAGSSVDLARIVSLRRNPTSRDEQASESGTPARPLSESDGQDADG